MMPRTHTGRIGRRASTWLCGAAVAALAAASAAAQDTAASSTVEEIIVTANKRAERLQDVPASVSAVTGDSLTAIGAARLEDYVSRVPGLVLHNVSFQNGSNQLTIRGVTTGVGANPTVGIYIDDAPFGGTTGSGAFQVPDLDPSDLARIEVLRGPQGTLYGAGAMGGLFKYVTAEPDPSGFSGRLEVGGSQVDGGGSSHVVRGAMNVPINETLALRVSAYERTDPGFVNNVANGQQDVNEGRFWGSRAFLAWTPNDSWKIRLSGVRQSVITDGSAVVDYNSVTMRPIYGDLNQKRSPGTGRNKERFGAYDLQVEGDLGWATLTSSSSYNTQTVNLNLDVTAAYQPTIASLFGVAGGGAAILTKRTLEKYTQEVRLTSPEGEGKLSWMAGIFYTDESPWLRQQIATFSAATGGPLPVALPSFLDATIDYRFKEIAAFGNLTYKFTDRFDVTVGLRYSENEQKQVQTNSGLLVGAGVIPGASKDDSLTYLINPRFHITEDTMAYLRVASGYRPGGPNLTLANVPRTYKPDEVVNYEAGLKTTLLDGTLTLDLAAFYIDWTDIQFNERNPQGLNYFGNGGAATSTGFEAAASWRPVQGLELNGNLSHTVAELDADLPPGSVAAKKGDPLPTSPEWSGQLSADYTFPAFGDWSARLGASYRYVGDAAGYFSSPAVPRYRLPSYDVVDLRAGLETDRFTVSLFAKNLGDSRGQVASYLLGGETKVAIIQPRTFGVSLAANF